MNFNIFHTGGVAGKIEPRSNEIAISDQDERIRKNVTVLAGLAGLDPEQCMTPKYGTPEMRVYKQARGLATGEFAVVNGAVVCSFCGGNCGQCGNTGTIENIPADMSRMGNNLGARRSYTILQNPKVRKEGRPSLRVVLHGLLYLAAMAMILSVVFLAGCSAYPYRTTPDEHGNYCSTCVGPYDITLSSHRKALGLED